MIEKVLNLYAGIGGNRKLWEGVEVTAIENNPQIAKIYQDFFPDDTVIVTDAHQYLLEHFNEFDFIWSSPPCPTHSKIRRIHYLADDKKQGKIEAKYPDMKLYEEILLLQGYFKGNYCVENVEGWYKPLIEAQKNQRHLFWTNFSIRKIDIESGQITGGSGGKVSVWEKKYGFNLAAFNISNKKKGIMLRNCVHPELGLHVFNSRGKPKRPTRRLC